MSPMWMENAPFVRRVGEAVADPEGEDLVVLVQHL